MKAGSPWVKGTVHREGADLIFTVQKKHQQNIDGSKGVSDPHRV